MLFIHAHIIGISFILLQ